MTKRRCLGCPALIEPGAYRGRCPACAALLDKARGTTTQRGYGASHQALSRDAKRQVRDGATVTCWRCGKPITDPADLHIGHDDDRSITRGPEHAGCNLSAAGRASHK